MTGSQDLFQQAMNQGHSAAWDQMWDRAAMFYRQALEEFPNQPQALSNLGLALYEMQEYEQALECYKQAAQAASNDPIPFEKIAQLSERLGSLGNASQAYMSAAELYLKNRDANKAIENWQRVTRLNPEHLHAHARLALVHERMGEKEKAVSEYIAIASLLQSAGQFEKAVRAVNQALQVLPNSEEAIQALTLLRDFKPLPKPTRPRGGTAPLRMAQVKQLESDASKEDTTESGADPIIQLRQKALTVLAGMLFDSPEEDNLKGSSRSGLSTLVRGKGILPRHVDRTLIILHLSQVVDQQTRKNYAQAAEELQRAIDAGLDHAAAYYDLGYLYMQLERQDEALRNMAIAKQDPDFSLGANLALGKLYRETDRLSEAAVAYLEALKAGDSLVVSPAQADDLRQLYDPLIETLREQADPEAQERLCDNISAMLMRADWRSHLSRARKQLPSQGKDSPPIPLAEILTEAKSGQMVESLTKIYDLARLGLLRSAMEECFYALQHAPTYLPLHSFMADLLVKENRPQEAAAKLMVVARTYSVRGESARAIELYRKIIELAPMDLNARNLLIAQLVARGQVDIAIQEYIDLGEAYYNLADLEMARKSYTEALRQAQKSNVDRASRVNILHHMADIDLQSLDWRQALRVYEQIRTLQPNDEKARSSLIELNFRLGQEGPAISELDNYLSYLASAGQRQAAISFVENMLTEEPDRVPVQLRLADLYRLSGRKEAAIETYDKVGESLLNAGDRLGALQALEAILALNPPNRDDYTTLLNQLRSK